MDLTLYTKETFSTGGLTLTYDDVVKVGAYYFIEKYKIVLDYYSGKNISRVKDQHILLIKTIKNATINDAEYPVYITHKSYGIISEKSFESVELGRGSYGKVVFDPRTNDVRKISTYTGFSEDEVPGLPDDMIREVAIYKYLKDSNCGINIKGFKFKPETDAEYTLERGVGTLDSAADQLRDSPEQLNMCLYQLVDTLSKLHRVRINHLDIKGGNIIITEDGRFVFVDYGISRIFKSYRDNTMCTVMYGPPEVELYKLKYDFLERFDEDNIDENNIDEDNIDEDKVDVFSLGITILQLLCDTQISEPASKIGTKRIQMYYNTLILARAYPEIKKTGEYLPRFNKSLTLSREDAYAETRTFIKRFIRSGMSGVRNLRLNPNLEEVLIQMLCLSPKHRATAREIVEMPFFNNMDPLPCNTQPRYIESCFLQAYENSSDLNNRMRKILYSWLHEVAAVKKVNGSTIMYSFDICNRYIYAKPDTSHKLIQMYATAALYISSVLYEEYPLGINILVGAGAGAFTKNDFLTAIFDMVHTLDCDLIRENPHYRNLNLSTKGRWTTDITRSQMETVAGMYMKEANLKKHAV